MGGKVGKGNCPPKKTFKIHILKRKTDGGRKNLRNQDHKNLGCKIIKKGPTDLPEI